MSSEILCCALSPFSFCRSVGAIMGVHVELSFVVMFFFYLFSFFFFPFNIEEKNGNVETDKGNLRRSWIVFLCCPGWILPYHVQVVFGGGFVTNPKGIGLLYAFVCCFGAARFGLLNLLML